MDDAYARIMDDSTPDLQTVLDRLERAEERIEELETENRQLREENQRLREENERLREENERLREENERLRDRVDELEHQLGQNSSNSHRPPSTDDPWEDDGETDFQISEPRRQGAQPGHPGSHRELVDEDEVDEIVDVKPEGCGVCGGALSGEEDDSPWRHQVWEVEVSRQVVEYRMHRGQCESCGRCERAGLPDGVPDSAFGDSVCAWVSWLSGEFDLSKRQLEKLVEKGFEIPMSLGSVCALERRAQRALAPAYAEAVDELQESGVLWVDETGWPETNERGWLWAAVGDDDTEMTVYQINPSRSRKALEKLVDETFDGIVTSDRYGAYRGRETERRQICWQHLVRDFKGLAARDGPPSEPARHLLTIAWLIFWNIDRIRQGESTWAEVRANVEETWRPATRQILERAAANDQAPGIFENLLRDEAALWTFAHHEAVEPTNNRAERAVRPAVIKRKLSFGTQSADGSRYIERMLTVCETLRRQSRSVLDFLVDSLLAWRTRQTPPTLVPS